MFPQRIFEWYYSLEQVAGVIPVAREVVGGFTTGASDGPSICAAVPAILKFASRVRSTYRCLRMFVFGLLCFTLEHSKIDILAAITPAMMTSHWSLILSGKEICAEVGTGA